MDEAWRAFQALQGHRCDGCGKHLAVGDLECCHRAYCPWCRTSNRTGCEHLVARRSMGGWSVPGVATSVAARDPTLHPSTDEDGDERFYDALVHAYDTTLNFPRVDRSGLPVLPDCVIGRILAESGGTASAWCRGPIPSHRMEVHFSREPEVFRAQATRRVDDWRTGPRGERKMPSESVRRLADAFSGPVTPVRCAIVSPTGMHVAVVGGNVLEVFSSVDGSVCRKETLPWVMRMWAPFPDRRSLVFAAAIAAGCDVACHGGGIGAPRRRRATRRYDWKGATLTLVWDIVAEFRVPDARPEPESLWTSGSVDVPLRDDTTSLRRLVLRPRVRPMGRYAPTFAKT